MSSDNNGEVFRDDGYAEKYCTGIFQEVPSKDNPYVESEIFCYGFDFLELTRNLGFSDYLFLLFRSKLPSDAESRLLNRTLIALSNLGVRHPATRSAVVAGVGKTVPSNILPASLLVLSGKENGAGSIEEVMKFQRKAINRDIERVVEENNETIDGFGLFYGSENNYLDRLSEVLSDGFDWPYLKWGNQYIAKCRSKGVSIGWLHTGLAAAVFSDLGFLPKYAPGLMQMFAAPGLLVQAMENANSPTTVLPFVSDEDYVIE